jgi:hypothetical protein
MEEYLIKNMYNKMKMNLREMLARCCNLKIKSQRRLKSFI